MRLEGAFAASMLRHHISLIIMRPKQYKSRHSKTHGYKLLKKPIFIGRITLEVFKKPINEALVSNMKGTPQTLLRVSACRLGPCLPMTFTIDWLKAYHTRRGGGRQQHTKNQEVVN